MAKPITVDYLARVEGEAGLTIRYRGDRVTGAELRVFEPPRLFEGLLRGRAFHEAPDITARICGICPVAYQTSSCLAMEAALGVEVTPVIRRLRRLLYCGEWIESHVLHIFMLHAPDFLGCQDVLEMAKTQPDLVRNALRLKKAGNDLVRAIGGREIHPINPRVGGFHSAPRGAALRALLPDLEWSLETMRGCMDLLAGLRYPAVERDYEFVSLRHERDYPVDEGRLVSSKGLDLDVSDYEDVFEEEHVARSNALHSRIRGRGAYLTGPLARINLNFDRLSPAALEAAATARFTVPCTNPFRSLLARAIETVQVLDEAVRLIRGYEEPRPACVPCEPRAGTGHGASEAPRGILYHRYTLDPEGIIVDARIVPPTAQNLRTMEEDLLEIAPRLVRLPHAEATWLAEQAVRNYDPCISCATHFLTLRIETS